MGARIDAHDTVIRLNRLPTSLYEEPDVGRKTDILWIDRNLSRIELMGGSASSCPNAGPDCTFDFSALIVHNWDEQQDCALWSKAPYTIHTMHTHLQYEIDHFLGMFVQGVDTFSVGVVSFVAFAQLCDVMTLFGFGVLKLDKEETNAINDEWEHNLTREHNFIDRVAQGTLDFEPGSMRRYNFPANSTERRLARSIQRLAGHVERVCIEPSAEEQPAATMQAILLVVLLALGVGSAALGYACRAGREHGRGSSMDGGGGNSDSDESRVDASADGKSATSEDGDELEVLMKKQAKRSNFSMQAWIVCIFVVSSSGQALAISVARGPTGKLPFDFAVAVFASEAMKLVVAIGWLLGTGCLHLTFPPPRPWILEAADLSVVAALFTLQNELNYIVIELIGAVLFTLLSNLKIVCTAIAMKCLLGKEFSVLQWIGIVMLTASAMVVKAPAIALVSMTGESAATFSSSQMIGVLLLQINSMSAGFAAVRNELIFKRIGNPTSKMPFMLQNCVLYMWGLVLNFVSWYIWGEHAFMAGINGGAWISIISAAIFGLGVAMMLRFLDNVVRCFASVGQVLFTVVVSRVLPSRYIHHRSNFDVFYVLSLVLLVSALVVYQRHDSIRLHCTLLQAVGATLVLGLIVLWLEQFAHSD